MNEFDLKASEWDKNIIRRERAEAVAEEIMKQIPLNSGMTAMEFGAGTGLLSFLLKDHIREITLVDNSPGMISVLEEKCRAAKADNLKVLNTDLEQTNSGDSKFNLIYSLMVLHHINDIEKITEKFYEMLVPGGYLAIADLYSEDGSFHGPGFTGHNGFDADELSVMLREKGFAAVTHKPVYVMDKLTTDNTIKKFGIFLLTAIRSE